MHPWVFLDITDSRPANWGVKSHLIMGATIKLAFNVEGQKGEDGRNRPLFAKLYPAWASAYFATAIFMVIRLQFLQSFNADSYQSLSTEYLGLQSWICHVSLISVILGLSPSRTEELLYLLPLQQADSHCGLSPSDHPCLSKKLILFL